MDKKKLFFGGLVLLALLALGIGVKQLSSPRSQNSAPDTTVVDLDSSSESKKLQESQQGFNTEKAKASTEVKDPNQKKTSSKVSKQLKKQLKQFNEKALKNDYYIQGSKGYEKVSIEKLENIESKQALEGVSLVRDNSDGKMKYLITFKE